MATFEVKALAEGLASAPEQIHTGVELSFKVDANTLESAVKISREWLGLQRDHYFITEIKEEGDDIF
jgi:hypothetical protein